MKPLKIKIGYYASIINLSSTILFGFCFFSLFLINPIFEWTTLPDYVTYNQTYDQSLKYAAQSLMIVFSISLLIIFTLIDDFENQEKKFFSKLGLHFISIATTLICLGYFIQITTVRWNFENEQLAGLEHFIQFYPHSAILSIIMLGYTLFLGLAMVSLLPLFNSKKESKRLRLGLLISAISCGLGFIGFVFQIIPLILLSTNIGNGIGFIILGLGLLTYFKK